MCVCVCVCVCMRCFQKKRTFVRDVAVIDIGICEHNVAKCGAVENHALTCDVSEWASE